jgi:uncharacterized protein YbaR (Trm112 family)
MRQETLEWYADPDKGVSVEDVQECLRDWQYEVQNGDTKLGLVDFILAEREQEELINAELKERYPIQDDTWPSRRWNADHTDYVDLSG